MRDCRRPWAEGGRPLRAEEMVPGREWLWWTGEELRVWTALCTDHSLIHSFLGCPLCVTHRGSSILSCVRLCTRRQGLSGVKTGPSHTLTDISASPEGDEKQMRTCIHMVKEKVGFNGACIRGVHPLCGQVDFC